MIVGQHIQWNTICDAPNLHSILNKKLDDFIIATDPTYGTGELTYYYQVDYYNSDIIISVYQYVDGCFVKVTGCGYNNNRVQTVSLVTPTTEPQTETCCTQQTPVQCVPQQPTIPIPSATNDHTKLINKNADANFQHVTLAEKEKWNSQTTDVLGTVLTGLTEASTMTNLESTDTVLGAFGKIKKWLGSLKALAFKDKADYDTDIDNIPTYLVQDANYVHTDNNYTNADAQIVANTSGTNTGDQVGDGATITGAGTIADPFVATNTSLWQQKDDVVLSGCFIPSTGELQEIHDVLLASGVLLHNFYWSSSEVDAANAYYFKMSTNEVLSDTKDAMLIFPLIVRKFTTTDVHELLESTTCSFLHIGSFSSATATIYKIVDNGTDFTYWQVIEATSFPPVAFSGDNALVGTTSQAVGEGENNTNEIALADPLSYAYALKNTIEVVINNSQIIEPKNDKFIETADIIDIDKYLKKDTTLQSSDTPEDTSLFSFWKIGVGRVKIAFSELITNVMHSQLGGLDWLGSGHTGTANKLFGSDANGLAKEYDLYTVSEITLLASGWSASSQTLTVSGVTATDDLTPYPKLKADQDKWADAELFCSAHTTNSVTFTCATTPTSDIVILLKIQKR
jgi:hypothetical protein